MAVATYEELIKGLHKFDYGLDSLDSDVREKILEEARKKVPEKRGVCASFEEMIKGLHAR